MHRWLWIAGLVAVAAAAWGVHAAVEARRPRGSDTLQILRMLQQGEAAAERRDVSGITRFVSPDYRDTVGMNAERLRFQIADYFRRRTAPLEVEIPSRAVLVQVEPGGRLAAVQFPLLLGGTGEGAAPEMRLTLRLRKEQVFYYWLFPGEEWRITSAEGYVPFE